MLELMLNYWKWEETEKKNHLIVLYTSQYNTLAIHESSLGLARLTLYSKKCDDNNRTISSCVKKKYIHENEKRDVEGMNGRKGKKKTKNINEINGLIVSFGDVLVYVHLFHLVYTRECVRRMYERVKRVQVYVCVWTSMCTLQCSVGRYERENFSNKSIFPNKKVTRRHSNTVKRTAFVHSSSRSTVFEVYAYAKQNDDEPMCGYV